MANILASLNVSAGALNAFDLALETTQNNVANAQTPGYAAQTQVLDSLAFNLSAGEIGGVSAGPVVSARDQFAEQNVHNQNMLLGSATQDVNSLTQLQNLFPVSDTSGIANALNGLYSSFSGWATNPNDSSARQSVMNNAATAASAFQETAQGLTQFTQSTNEQIQETVTGINQLAAQLTADNQQIQAGNGNDAGLDANIHNTLDQLSQYVNFTATQQSDGTYSILVDGQTPLVMGSQQFSLGFQMAQPSNPPPVNVNAPPHAAILGSDGSDITSQVTGGQLGSLVNLRNYGTAHLHRRRVSERLHQYVGATVCRSREQLAHFGQRDGWPPGASGYGTLHVRHDQPDQCGADAGCESVDHRRAIGRDPTRAA